MRHGFPHPVASKWVFRLNHAMQDRPGSYEVCRDDLKWIDKMEWTKQAPPMVVANTINSDRVLEPDITEKNADLPFRAHAKNYPASCFPTWLNYDESLDDIIRHAAQDKNRSREILMGFGWMDKDGEPTKTAPAVIAKTIQAIIASCTILQKKNAGFILPAHAKEHSRMFSRRQIITLLPKSWPASVKKSLTGYTGRLGLDEQENRRLTSDAHRQ